MPDREQYLRSLHPRDFFYDDVLYRQFFLKPAVTAGLDGLDLVDNIHTLDNFAEYAVADLILCGILVENPSR